MTPVFEDSLVTLYCGDFHEVLSELGHVDAIVTDPPYGETSLEWDRWPRYWLQDLQNVASNLWCFGSMRMFLEHADEFMASWKLAQDTVWEKHNGSGFAKDRFKRVHEFATQWYRGEWGALYNHPPTTPDAVRKTVHRKERPPHAGEIADSRYETMPGADRLMRSVIKLRSMHGRAINETEKPVQLVSLYVAASVPPGGTVFDPFAGSCSTGVAARQLGRRAILVEKRQSQCDAAARRLERETEQPFDFASLENVSRAGTAAQMLVALPVAPAT